jgi:replicative DNA helicase
MSITRRTDTPRRNGTPERPAPLFDRSPPVDLEAEISVLGSIMLLPDVCDDVALILRPDDFYDDAHRKIFRHMLDMHDAGRKIDPTLLIDKLKTAGDYESIGGAAYLGKILHAVANAAHAVYYAEIVAEKSTFRQVIEASTETLREAYDESLEASQVVARAEARVFNILDERGNTSVSSMQDILHEAMDRLEARMRGEFLHGGVETGFSKLDEQTGGLHNSELIVIAARPSMGKTAFALNIAGDVAIRQQVPTLFVSLEMAAIELAERLLCSVAKVNGHRLRNGTISQEDRMRLVETSGEISRAPLFVDDSPGRTVTEVAAAARRIRRREGRLGLIVIDYLQLLEPDNPKDPRQEQVSKMTRRLKSLAREMEVPIVCLAQLNRQTEAAKDNIPRLSHLRESGAIEQDADVVMFVHREEYYHRGEDAKQYEGKAQIIVAKQRNGPVGEIDLAWLRDYTRFENLAEQRFDEFDSYNANAGSASF